MALIYSANNTPATSDAAVYLLKTLLKGVGWTVPRSSDGLTYNSSGDQITSGGTGAGGMRNNLAWFEITPPGGTGRHYCFQVNVSSPSLWRISTALGAFTAGTPSATQTPAPSGTDRIYISGGGTEAVPGFAGALFQADGTYRYHAAADNAAPYGFYSVGYATGGGLPGHALIVDPVTETDTGETDSFVFYGSNGPTTSNLLGTLTSNPSGSFFNPQGGGSVALMNVNGVLTFTSVCPLVVAALPLGGLSSMHGQLGPNPVNSKTDLLPAYYGTASSIAASNFGIKGRSSLIKLPMTSAVTGDTLSVSGAGAKDWIVLGGVALPWNGSVPLV